MADGTGNRAREGGEYGRRQMGCRTGQATGREKAESYRTGQATGRSKAERHHHEGGEDERTARGATPCRTGGCDGVPEGGQRWRRGYEKKEERTEGERRTVTPRHTGGRRGGAPPYGRTESAKRGEGSKPIALS
ncbi:hypothetical protein ACMD2_23112 [Ananas comosus]|uniref:Uncharacterized protein n=1 Tax=Ananas comosus TaxID=4615 RepID=A0A199VXE0_ANACO|nr:hypothetical protein ACMD2_23112 [Ananas comosus]